ncbi:ionotropic receptor 21a-like [Macrobrachium rosenbergii]|uniref:ionotropic receptor 21a-like n=1 Tax=Macrobrachium rosenbergii TaxID=79674 RepID=UPI0034D6DEA4
MAPLLSRVDGKRNVGVFSFFPFSPDDPVRLLRSWGSLKLSGSLQDIFTDRFETFEGYEFQLATWFDDRPYLYHAKSDSEEQGAGVVVEMLRAMAITLNYTYQMTPISSDYQWGSFENGEWKGMLGMVHRREKNFTVNYFVITSERAQSFDASTSYWMEGFGISLLLPSPLPKWRGFYYPLQAHVWFGVVLTLGVTILLMTIQDRWQPRPFLKSFGRAWIYFLRLLFNQSLPTLPSAHRQRVFVGCWCFYCFILTTAYTANLVAFLTIPVFPKRIQTVRQLAESDYSVAMIDYGEFVPGALKSSRDPHYRTLGKKLDLWPEIKDAVALVLRGTHALIDSYSYSKILFVVDFEEKNTYMLREQIYPGHLCWYFPKNTAWKHKFDYGIQRLVEAGLIARWIKLKTEDFLGRDFEKRQEMEAHERKKSALTIEHLQGVFFILVMSWFLSVFVFITELIRGSLLGHQGSLVPREFLRWICH